VADPVPLLVASVSHAALLVALHVASLGVTVRPTLPLPAVAGAVAVAVANAYVGVTPLCVTVKVCPPIVSVPVRLFALAFAATLYVTVPLPVVDAPPVIVSHATFEAAVQA